MGVEGGASLGHNMATRNEVIDLRGPVGRLRHPRGARAAAVDLRDLVVIVTRQVRRESRPPRSVERKDPYSLLYTSGTTAPPEGCVLSHRQLRDVVDMCHRHDRLPDTDTIYLHLPLAHTFGLQTQVVLL